MKKTGFPKASLIFALLAAAFLAVAFTVPRAYLSKMTFEMRTEAQKANAAIIADDMATSQTCLEKMKEVYEERKSGVEMFFHHEDIDDLDCALNTAIDLARLEQSDNLICELHKILEILDHMEYVEMVDLSELL